MSLPPPTTLGKYQIIREIARSNDIVYEGYDPLMTRRVAVKEMNVTQGATDSQRLDRIDRFKREAQAAGRLNHPNIMTVYDVEEDAGRLFMAMEYLDGGTLRAEIDGAGSLTPERAVAVARAVLAGLQHAHSQGVVHRDIKPDNVQILSNGAIKITDFGIARLTFQPNLTMDGQVFGTPSYMSPEQVVGKEIDPRSDLFSVGVMLYEMLAGRKPFAGDSVVAITYAIMNREPDALPADVPWALGEAVRKALEKVPSLRFADADEMGQALEEALRPAPPPPAYDPVPSTPAPTYSPYGVPPVVSQPYNPYGAPTPAPAYPYNPYTQQPYGGPGPAPAPYMGSTMAPPQTPVPVYYPPPPRAPLLKPETAAFLKKLTLAFIVLGTFFALILVAAQALVGAAGRVNAERRTQPIHEAVAALDAGLPPDVQIRQLLTYREGLRGADTSEVDGRLGEQYRRLAEVQAQAGQSENADRSFQNALQYAPHDAPLLAAYGKFFSDQALLRPEGSPERADLFRQASDQYFAAAGQENRSDRQSQDGFYGATMAYQYAYNAQRSGDPEARVAARRSLETAQPYASADPNLAGRIESLLAELRGGE